MSRPDDSGPAPAAAMWWDGGERAITAREKARIEEHSASCFSIALVPAGSSAAWTLDARTYGNALNEAAWLFVDQCPEKSALLFNSAKVVLRSAILRYGDLVAGAAPQLQPAAPGEPTAAVKQSLTAGEVQGSREQFEVWARPQFPGEEAFDRIAGRPGGWEYTGNAVQAAWAAWQAALASAQTYSIDADPAGISARVADVITGALMVGAQGHTPPPAGHWAEPFWQMARADAAAQGIDLGPVRSALQAAEGLCVCCAAVDSYSRNELHAFGLNMRQQFADALRLVEGQRDAAPGVDRG